MFPSEDKSELKADVLFRLSRLANALSNLATEVRQGEWNDREELENLWYSLEAGENALEYIDLPKQGDDTAAAWVVHS